MSKTNYSSSWGGDSVGLKPVDSSKFTLHHEILLGTTTYVPPVLENRGLVPVARENVRPLLS